MVLGELFISLKQRVRGLLLVAGVFVLVFGLVDEKSCDRHAVLAEMIAHVVLTSVGL